MMYQWRALDAKGAKKQGTLEATSLKAAREALREQGLIPVAIDEKKGLSLRQSGLFRPRLKLKGHELSLFTRQLATLANASLPLEEALHVIARQNKNNSLGKILASLREHILSGHPLSDALAVWPHVFDSIYRTLVKAGEKSGQLGLVLEKLADYNEIRQKTRSSLIQALVYPAMLTSVAIIVVTILLTAVVPKVVEQFVHMKQQLPLTTRILLAISDALQSYGFIAVVLMLLVSAGFIFWRRRPLNRHRMDRKLLDLPLLRGLIRAINCARYLRTLSILQASGVPLLEGMTLSGEGIGNSEIRQRLTAAADRVRQGSGFHTALEKCDLFPPMTLYMVASGEKSGQLGELMERAADQQETLLQNRITLGLALFEPALVVSMSFIVLFIIMAVLQPILQLNSLIS
ncbi:type II secretion system inner membrane protein GspF [Scandinavium sp. V105_16]|uniref:Type II secretion system inner membrane protein GspF n=1 Tax=Scandinavium lactucae TaxID=3095028 RepID=A0AAJ2S9Y5_9ENTR|nr:MULTISPECIES: type II secretion system inner membrane protein GspF [unclassified Scandinavium]MDX6019498.1 type II secretion system inner membrane protein GspF [Scandinavium sp. V105_16]MDX6032748.1 type II secretion system inner membrane protein GspF [Scandinavium sp. V105_12]